MSHFKLELSDVAASGLQPRRLRVQAADLLRELGSNQESEEALRIVIEAFGAQWNEGWRTARLMNERPTIPSVETTDVCLRCGGTHARMR